MAKKLSVKDMTTAVIAVNNFKHSCMEEHENKAQGTIIVQKNGVDIHTFEEQDFRVIMGTNYHVVEIYWDEFFPGFKQEGLFLSYRTDYVKMNSSYKELTIYSNNLKIIIRAWNK